nr:selenide, water dikinase SelD [Desulfobacterales bacterium]
MSPVDLDEVIRGLPFNKDPNLLIGYETSDDAGVYRIADDLALVQTVDYFTPMVDDPYQFGRIAAANALSDIYAMGGRPVTAMNIVCFPAKVLSMGILREILRGGLEKVEEAGAVLVGGHSLDDQELKYGLSVTGFIHPDRIITNGGALVGDKLILTKPLGIGVISTAIKGKLASRRAVEAVTRVAATLNRAASEIMLKYRVHACTDITGFGLAGHLLEMARASGVEIAVFTDKIPLIPESKDYATMGLLPAGSYANKRFCGSSVEVDSDKVENVVFDLIFDPQTSGGLVISISEEDAKECLFELRQAGISNAEVIGEVIGSSKDGRLRLTSTDS